MTVEVIFNESVVENDIAKGTAKVIKIKRN